MYTAKEISKEFGGGKKMSVGIHINCSLDSVNVGENYVDFNYSNSAGETHNKRVWFPDPSKVYVRDSETDQQALERSKKEALAHVVKHMNIFMSKEQVDTFSAPDFVSFVKGASTLIDASKDSTKVNLKLIPDNKLEYSTFGRYPDYIEECEEGAPVGIQFTSWEQTNRVNPYNAKLDNSVDSGESKANDLGSII